MSDTDTAQVAKQGHRYRYLDRWDVLAMETGTGTVLACRIYPSLPWPLGKPFRLNTDELVPLPMVYFHGMLPE